GNAIRDQYWLGVVQEPEDWDVFRDVADQLSRDVDTLRRRYGDQITIHQRVVLRVHIPNPVLAAIVILGERRLRADQAGQRAFGQVVRLADDLERGSSRAVLSIVGPLARNNHRIDRHADLWPLVAQSKEQLVAQIVAGRGADLDGEPFIVLVAKDSVGVLRVA